MIAFILRIPDEIALSCLILNLLILPVLETWVPPHNSLENSPIVTTLTWSPYFSPNNAVAPSFLASSKLLILVSTVISSSIFWFTINSIDSNSFEEILFGWVISNLKYSG